MNPDAIVIRHSAAGAPHLLARLVDASVINAGDGMHAHPTQALLDMMTVREKKGRLDGLRLAIIGDIAHSRVARSNIIGFNKMGADVVLAGPPTMIPMGIETLGAVVSYDVEEVIKDADVVMVLRIQKERLQAFAFSSEREYAQCYGLNEEKLAGAKKDLLIMHPGPINRGIEISPEVAEGPYSVILEQVANGVAVRMALLYLLLGGPR
jgi:aspartate carbamoyltransferase catalytic subunit